MGWRIHMDNLNILLMGTFCAYVLFDDDKYAGTWAHERQKVIFTELLKHAVIKCADTNEVITGVLN